MGSTWRHVWVVFGGTGGWPSMPYLPRLLVPNAVGIVDSTADARFRRFRHWSQDSHN
jgi:hypothetical protein